MTPNPRSTGVTLAALGAGMIGLWNVLTGIAAVSSDPATERLGEVLFEIDIQVWGYVWLVIGLIQMVVAYFVFQREPWAVSVGIGWAAVNVTMAVFIVFVAPIYALTVVAVNMAVIHALAYEISLPREPIPRGR
ncbi:MAG TPA: hypothetical protein VF228_23900 [Iamia sp.]